MHEPHLTFKKALSHLFSALDSHVTQQLIDKIRIVQVSSGDVLYRQGEPGDGLHILHTGRMQVDVYSEDKADIKTVGVLRAGDVVGEISLFTGGSRSATVVATRDSTLGYLSRKDFDQLMDSYPSIKLDIAYFIINRLTESQNNKISPVHVIKSIAVMPLDNQSETHLFSDQLHQSLQHYGSVGLVESSAVTAFYSDTTDETQQKHELELEQYLDNIEEENDFVVLVADSFKSSWTMKCATFADAIIFVSKAASSIDEAVKYFQNVTNSWRQITPIYDLVLLHNQQAGCPKNTKYWLKNLPVKRHHHMHIGQQDDISRLARILTGNSVSLVLSGGGARGFAHLGVIRAIREAGIPIDMIGGVSQGAIIAAGVAMEWDDKRMLEEYKAAYVDDNPGNDYTLPIFSIIKGEKMSKRLRRHFGDVEIEDLKVSFFSVSSNLSSGDEKIHRSGSLCQSLKASSAIPAILPPIIENSEVLVDGSVLNNLPVNVAREIMGGHIIAVDVSTDKDFEYKNKKLPTAWQYIKRSLFSSKSNKDEPKIQQIILKSMMLGGRREAGITKHRADLHIAPSVNEFDMFDWSNMKDICDEGYKQSKMQIKKWADSNFNSGK